MTDDELKAAGWSQAPTRLFSAAVGAFWTRGQGETREVAVFTTRAIANDHEGMVHGGAMMTFADMALGFAAGEALGGGHMATAQLQFHFTAATPIGVLLTCRPEVVRKTSQLVFVRGLFQADGRTVGMADAMFKVLDAGKMATIAAKSR
ncbi:MAG: PaaI family thioesterase [Novosphingobium sp.]